MFRTAFAVGLSLVLLAALVGPEAAAAEKKKVLIYGRTYGFRHGGSIDKGSPILKRLAEELGYEAVISEDPAVFDPDKVTAWDLIIFNNCTGGLNPKEPERREALMKRIKGGAGFMGFHAATDCNSQWPEYGEMLNGYFAGHPWNQKVLSKLEEKDHPLLAPFGGKSFEIGDEIYQFRNYKRSAVKILMSIDNTSVDVNRGGRKDRDYAICWIRPWEKGRVFYNAHGHHEGVFQNETFQQHAKLAMKWAIGDLEVDTTPSKEIDRDELGRKALETLAAATEDDQLIEALGVLSWCPRADALPKAAAMLERNQAVAAVAADAIQAIVPIADDVPKPKKIDVLKKALAVATKRPVRKSIREQLKGLGVTDLPINAPPGYVAHWFAAGPLPRAEDRLDEGSPPEKAVDLAAGFEVDGKKFAWKKVETDDDGILDLNANLRRASDVVGYMYAEITVEKETPAELRIGSDDGFALWLNGKQVAVKDVNRALRPASDKCKATLAAGVNKILMKVVQGGGDWAGCLQIVGAKGEAIEFTTRTK